MRTRWTGLPFLVLLLLAAAHPGATSVRAGAPPTRIYFVRHGETEANATGHYNSRTIDVLTPRGEAQVKLLTEALAHLKPDRILVSPMLRARRTILPYLRSRKTRAQIWPELAECCHQKDRTVAPSERLARGREVKLSAEDGRCFTLEGSPSTRVYAPASYTDGMEQVRILVETVRKRFTGSGLTVVMVGHSIAGSRLLESLLGLEPTGRYPLDNGALSLLEETPAGAFVLRRLNGRPAPPVTR